MPRCRREEIVQGRILEFDVDDTELCGFHIIDLIDGAAGTPDRPCVAVDEAAASPPITLAELVHASNGQATCFNGIAAAFIFARISTDGIEIQIDGSVEESAGRAQAVIEEVAAMEGKEAFGFVVGNETAAAEHVWS